MPFIKFGCGGIDISFLHDKIWDAIREITRVLGEDWMITSTNEGKHLPNSMHYRNKAIDLRLPFDTVTHNKDFVTELKLRLGKDYDIIYEKDHIHLEWDKKGA